MHISTAKSSNIYKFYVTVNSKVLISVICFRAILNWFLQNCPIKVMSPRHFIHYYVVSSLLFKFRPGLSFL